MRAQLERAGSVTLGINLDPQLRPESATIVALNPGKFAGKGTLLDRLFGDRAAADAVRGLGALYKAEEGGRQRTPEHDLFRDMERLIEGVAAPVAAALANYTRINVASLAGLAPELVFYLGAARLADDMRAAGLPLCRPTIAPVAERACAIAGLYSLDLALRLRLAKGAGELAATVVPNDVGFGPDARIYILTGPNSGGKTTYTRAVGQAQVLFQAGLLVPGRQARISPADAIYTHFAAPERPDRDGGRLAEELERLGQLFQQASAASLLLLNEPLASTDHAASHLLSRDILAGLWLLGARALFVTHLHELVDALEGTELDGVVSLTAGYVVPEGNGAAPAPSYVIIPGRPQVAGYAAELARRHGLSRDQIAATLRARGLADDRR
jgi:DNA mismatch repair protein MutS